MSKLEELIEQYCPDEVEWKTLEDVCQKVFAGGTPTSSNSSYYGGDIPWLRSGEVNFNEINSTEKTITEEGYKSSSAKWIEKHSVLIAMTGATVARSAMTMIDLTANQSVCALTPDRSIISYRYLYYWISRSYLQLKGMAQGALTSLNLNIIKALEIPVPPLPVQEEIVRILDAFTELQAELQAELQKRLQQYNYYRDNLLSVYSDSNTVRILELQQCVSPDCSMSYGVVQPGEDFIGGIPVVRPVDLSGRIIHNKGIKTVKPILLKAYSRTELKGGELLVCVRGTTGVVAFAGEDLKGGNVTRGIVPLRFNPLVNSNYMYHLFNSRFVKKQIENKTQGAALQQINVGDLKKISIPVPPLEEQNRIVAILDRFDTLTNDLTSGIPAEMEKRRQQYEFYRDKLLTFKRKEA